MAEPKVLEGMESDEMSIVHISRSVKGIGTKILFSSSFRSLFILFHFLISYSGYSMPTLFLTPENNFAWNTTFPKPEPMSTNVDWELRRSSSSGRVSSMWSSRDTDCNVASPYPSEMVGRSSRRCFFTPPGTRLASTLMSYE